MFAAHTLYIRTGIGNVIRIHSDVTHVFVNQLGSFDRSWRRRRTQEQPERMLLRQPQDVCRPQAFVVISIADPGNLVGHIMLALPVLFLVGRV